MIKKIKKAATILSLVVLLSINSTAASADTTYEYSVLDEEEQEEEQEEEEEEETDEDIDEDIETYADDLEETAQFYADVRTDLSDIKVILFGILIAISFAGGYILSLIIKR